MSGANKSSIAVPASEPGGAPLRPDVRAVMDQFLKGWMLRKYKDVLANTSVTIQSRSGLGSSWLNYFKQTSLYHYDIMSEFLVYDGRHPLSPEMIIDISVNLYLRARSTQARIVRGVFRLIREKEAYTPSIHGTWGVNPVSLVFKESGGRE
jgi:hypothetical protein